MFLGGRDWLGFATEQREIQIETGTSQSSYRQGRQVKPKCDRRFQNAERFLFTNLLTSITFFLEVFFISVTLTLRIAILYSLIVERLFG